MDKALEDKISAYIMKLITDFYGRKKFKSLAVVKEVTSAFSDQGATKRDVKSVIKKLVDSGKLSYFYAGAETTLTLANPPDKANK